MIIEIQRPELESLIRERMASGVFQDVEDVLYQALQAPPPNQGADMGETSPKKSFGQFLLESPLRNSGLKIERQKDYPRPIEL